MPLVREFRQVEKPAALIAALAALWGQDKVVEARLRRYRLFFIISAVASVIGIFVSSALSEISQAFFLVWFVPVASAVINGILWWRHARLNLDDRRILTPLKFLQIVQADVQPREPVRLVVSFEDYRKHGKKLAEDKPSSGVRHARYEDTWLEAEGYLADRTRFRLTVSQKISRTEKRKRKYTKTRERMRESVLLVLRPNRKLYDQIDRFPSLFAAGEDMGGLRFSKARVGPRAVVLEAFSPQPYTKLGGRTSAETGAENLVSGDKLLVMMAAAFDRLGQCRTSAAAS